MGAGGAAVVLGPADGAPDVLTGGAVVVSAEVAGALGVDVANVAVGVDPELPDVVERCATPSRWAASTTASPAATTMNAASAPAMKARRRGYGAGKRARQRGQ